MPFSGTHTAVRFLPQRRQECKKDWKAQQRVFFVAVILIQKGETCEFLKDSYWQFAWTLVFPAPHHGAAPPGEQNWNIKTQRDTARVAAAGTGVWGHCSISVRPPTWQLLGKFVVLKDLTISDLF